MQAVQYDEGRLKSTRTLFRTQDTHGRAVMTGAVVSDARLHVILNEEMQSCTWCETEEVATWAHSAWSCSAFEETRLTQPDDAMQRVLGWPCGSPLDHAVITHLSRVRQSLLHRRYRAG